MFFHCFDSIHHVIHYHTLNSAMPALSTLHTVYVRQGSVLDRALPVKCKTMNLTARQVGLTECLQTASIT